MSETNPLPASPSGPESTKGGGSADGDAPLGGLPERLRACGPKDVNGVGIRVGDVVTVPGRGGAACITEAHPDRVVLEWDLDSGYDSFTGESIDPAAVVVMAFGCSYVHGAEEALEACRTDGGELGEDEFLFCDTHGLPATPVVYDTPEGAFHGPCFHYVPEFDQYSFKTVTREFEPGS